MEKNIGQYNITNYLNSTTKIVCSTTIFYILFAKLTKLIFISQIYLLPLFPAMGLATAFTIIFGRKAILGVAIGSLLFSLGSYKEEIFYAGNHHTFTNTLSICLIRPIMAVINAILVSHFTLLWCKTKYPFNKGTHILNFSVATLLGSIIAPTIGILFIAFFSSLSNNDLQLLWSLLIRRNVLGIILITPFVLSWLYKTEKKTQWTILKKAEAFSLPFITLVASIYAFETHAHDESILYLLLIWAGYRFNVKLITLLTLIIAIVSMYYTEHRMGGFAFSGWNNNFFLLQLFLFVNMVSILFFKAILMEKEAKENKLKISEQILSTERNILKATIESTNTTSIFSLDTNLNYLNFNSTHEKFMKDIHGASIKIGDNHMALITYEDQKAEYISIFQSVLNGACYEKEEKDIEGTYWKISKSPIRDNYKNIIGISVIITDISDLKLKEIQLKENNLSLNERIKEVSCLYTISKILNNKSLSISEKLQACAQIIPASFQFPEKTNCKIQFLEEEFLSENFKKSNFQTGQNIIINDEKYGFIEMSYFDAKGINGNYAFLKEEVKLLETLSEIIFKFLQTKIAEENLKVSEEKFRSIYENMQDVYYLHTLEGIILDVSPSVEKHFLEKRENFIGMHVPTFYSEPAKYENLKSKIIKEGSLNDQVIEFFTPSGETLFFSVNSKLINDSKGNPTLIEGTMRNINERIINQKQILEATEKIKESEAKFRSIFESFEDVYFKKTLDGILLDVSPSIEKYFKMKRETVIGMNAYDFYLDQAEGKRFYEAVLQNKQVHDYEARFLTGNGEIIYFSVSAKLMNDPNGQPAYLEGTMRDITERIQNREKLIEGSEKIKKSEEKFRSIFENMQDIYYLHNFDGKITEISPSCEKHFKYKREEMIGRYTGDLYFEPSKQNDLREKIIRDGFINDEQVQFITATGEPIFFSINCKIIHDQDGMPTHIEGSMRNVNERILSQKQLLEASEKIKVSEAKFRSIFENTQDVYYMHTLDGEIFEISPSVEKHLKYKREEAIGLNSKDLHYDKSRQKELREKVIKEGSLNDEHVQLVTATGEPIFFSINCKIIYNQSGIPTHVEGSLRNINDRILNQKQLLEANEKIKESEAKFRTIYENFDDIYYKTDLDGNIIDLSPSFEKNFKITSSQIIGKSSSTLYYDDKDRETFRSKLLENGYVRDFDSPYKDNQGNIIFFSVNGRFIYDDNGVPHYVEGTMRNIEERINNQKKLFEATEKIKESEAKFRSIYENFEDVYFKTKLDGTFVELSPSFEKHFLKSSAQAIGGSVLDLYYEEKDRTLLLEKLKIDNHISDFDAQFKDANGNAQFVSINAHFIYEDGIPVYIEGTLRNVNDRIAVQKEMLEKNRKLEFQNTELEQFAYIASHDLQEPLITVTHSIQMLEEELGENLDADQKQYLEFINSSTSRMQLLVKGLLDYSRIGKERKSNLIDCNEIVSNVLADMNTSLKESNASVEYENLPIIESNSTEMRQLFQNLISNANKFRKKDIQPKIKIKAVKENNNWLFSIQDNGIGIREQDMDKVFVIFKRLHNRHEYQGTGIGLSHCKKIIEQHRGKIWVESKYNEGSTFKWTLPIEHN